MNFVSFCSLLHAIVPKFPDVVVHDSYTVLSRIKVLRSLWAASNYHESRAATANQIARNVIVT